MLVQGESLSSSMGSDQTSNRASAETGMKGTQSYAKRDGQILQWIINDGLIAPYVRLNWGDVNDDELPKFRSRLVTRIDLTAARTLFDMGARLDGVPLANSAGVKLIVGEGAKDQVILERQASPAASTAPMTPPPDPAKSGKPERIPAADGDTPAQRMAKAAEMKTN